jgi:glucose 1-dehydrogenase
MTRVVLVTGAAGGIGRATTLRFAAASWTVLAVDRRPQAEAGPGVQVLQYDVSDPEQVESLFASIPGRADRLDALVNNAGIHIPKPLAETSSSEWDAVLASNVRSVFLTVKHGLPLLQAARGSVINVSSVHAIASSSNVAAYAASKGAMVALTRALAVELAPSGIRVNAVLPGAIDTPMLRQGVSRPGMGEGDTEVRLAALAARTVLGRIGRPEDIAEAILFLADLERSAFVTGQGFVIDGGATTRLSTE